MSEETERVWVDEHVRRLPSGKTTVVDGHWRIVKRSSKNPSRPRRSPDDQPPDNDRLPDDQPPDPDRLPDNGPPDNDRLPDDRPPDPDRSPDTPDRPNNQPPNPPDRSPETPDRSPDPPDRSPDRPDNQPPDRPRRRPPFDFDKEKDFTSNKTGKDATVTSWDSDNVTFTLDGKSYTLSHTEFRRRFNREKQRAREQALEAERRARQQTIDAERNARARQQALDEIFWTESEIGETLQALRRRQQNARPEPKDKQLLERLSRSGKPITEIKPSDWSDGKTQRLRDAMARQGQNKPLEPGDKRLLDELAERINHNRIQIDRTEDNPWNKPKPPRPPKREPTAPKPISRHDPRHPDHPDHAQWKRSQRATTAEINAAQQQARVWARNQGNRQTQVQDLQSALRKAEGLGGALTAGERMALERFRNSPAIPVPRKPNPQNIRRKPRNTPTPAPTNSPPTPRKRGVPGALIGIGAIGLAAGASWVGRTIGEWRRERQVQQELERQRKNQIEAEKRRNNPPKR